MSRDVSERAGRKALADCLWGASYEALLARQARAVADEIRVLTLRAQLLGQEEVELPTELVRRAADLFERMADFPPNHEART